MGYGPVYIEGPYNNGPVAKSIKGTIHIHPNSLISDDHSQFIAFY